MKTRKIFWLAVAVLAMIIIGVIFYISALYFERLLPIGCDATEDYLRGKADVIVIGNFLKNHPDAEFKNLGNKENMPMYCQYAFVAEDDGKEKQMIITVDKNLYLVRVSIE